MSAVWEADQNISFPALSTGSAPFNLTARYNAPVLVSIHQIIRGMC